MLLVEDMKGRINELADLMDEFGLAEARLEGEDWAVGFSRTRSADEGQPTGNGAGTVGAASAPATVPEAKPAGTPVTSPMNGIFYTAPSPGAPPFVREGEAVTAGQVVGLIEAMKVFNEITAPVSGTAANIRAESGQLVQPGEVLLYIQ